MLQQHFSSDIEVPAPSCGESPIIKEKSFFIRSLFNSRSTVYNMSAAIIGAGIQIQILDN
jgi:hypothetical protein